MIRLNSPLMYRFPFNPDLLETRRTLLRLCGIDRLKELRMCHTFKTTILV